MRIAIVEDTQLDLDDTLSAIKRYSEEKHIEIECDVFHSAEEFLLFKRPYQFCIFDIVLGGMSGMELAHKIRENDSRMIIVFLTSIAQYAIEGYTVNASGYVLKPINYYNFALAMSRAISAYKITFSDPSESIVRVGNNTIPIRSIVYCEVRDHTLVYHLQDEVLSCRGSLADVEKVAGTQFSRPHSSFLVNLAEVTSVKGSSICLHGGHEIPLARSKKKDFLAELAIFLGRNK